MQYTQTELKALIATVEKEFTADLKKTEEAVKAELSKSENANSTAPLAKAEDAPPADKKDKKPSEEKPEAKPESKEGEEKPAPEAKPEAAPAAEAKPAEAAPVDDGHGYDNEDMEHMNKMYSSMSKGELRAHHDAVKRCLDALAGHAGGPTGEPAPSSPAQKLDPQAMGKAEHSDGLIKPAAPNGAAGPTSPASKDQKNLTNMEKGEERTRQSGGKIEATGKPKDPPGAKSPASKDQGNLTNMEKSEKTEIDLVKAELDAEKAKFADLKKNFDGVQEFLTKLVRTVPQGKAITSMEQIAKSEGAEQTQELSKAEVNAILLKKSSDPNLSKADREAINAFYLSKSDVNTISHLLKN